jgi:hypothetical protein
VREGTFASRIRARRDQARQARGHDATRLAPGEAGDGDPRVERLPSDDCEGRWWSIVTRQWIDVFAIDPATSYASARSDDGRPAFQLHVADVRARIAAGLWVKEGAASNEHDKSEQRSGESVPAGSRDV